MKIRYLMIAFACLLTMAQIGLGQTERMVLQGPVPNRGPEGTARVMGPIPGGTRLLPPRDFEVEGENEDDDGETTASPLTPPATPAMAGTSFIDALRLFPNAGQLLQLPYAESLFGVSDLGSAPSTAANALSRTTALTTFWPNGATKNAGGIDPQIAASSWALGVLTWDQLAFYDKSGNLLPAKNGFPNPTNTETIFARLVNQLDNVINLAPEAQGDSRLLFANGQVGDARLQFDSFRKRWVVLATAKNNQATQAQYTNFYPNGLQWAMQRTQLLLAVSNDEDPAHGFRTFAFDGTPGDGACAYSTEQTCPGFLFTPGTWGDYPSLGISSRHYLLTIDVWHRPLADPTAKHLTGSYMVAVNADDCANIIIDPPRAKWFFKWDIGKSQVARSTAMPVVNHAPLAPADWGLVTLVQDNRLILTGVSTTDPPTLLTGWWDMPNLLTPVNWSQRDSFQAVTYSNLGVSPVTATQIGGVLSVAWDDGRNWGPSPGVASPSIHMFTANVSGFPFGVFALKDRVFGLRSVLDDDPADIVGYGLPGIAANKDGDTAVVYSRTDLKVYLEARYSTWLHNEPDIRPSRILQAGSAGTTCGNPCRPFRWDTAGIALDPFDQTGIWMAHGYVANNDPNSAQRRIAVGKVFGSQHPGLLLFDLATTVPSATGGAPLQVGYNIANGGDGTADAPYVEVSLMPTATTASPIMLGTDALPLMRPGETLTRTATMRIPDGIPAGTYVVRAVAKPGGGLTQYTEGVNFAQADQLLTIAGVTGR